MMKKISLLTGIFLLFCNFLIAKTITGIVTFKEKPLLGVYIQLKGLPVRTITDFDGKYTIEANEGDILEVNSLGYKTQQATVSKSNIINFNLEEDIETLDEVVVTGNGIKTKRGVKGIKEEEIERRQPASYEKAIKGSCDAVRANVQNFNRGCFLDIRGLL